MAEFRTPPKAFDPERVARVKAGLAEQGFASQEALLDAVFGNSPFLGRLAQRETGALGEYFAAGPETVVNAAVLLAQACAHAESEAQAMKDLRAAKRRAALAIAMADIAGLWEVEKVTAELTRFADACVQGALRFLLAGEAARGGVACRGKARRFGACGDWCQCRSEHEYEGGPRRQVARAINEAAHSIPPTFAGQMMHGGLVV